MEDVVWIDVYTAVIQGSTLVTLMGMVPGDNNVITYHGPSVEAVVNGLALEEWDYFIVL